MSFGHAGTIVEGAEDSATQKIARLEAAGIPVVERIDEIGRGQGEARGEGLMARTEELQGIFIDVEVSDEIRGDAEMAAKLEEVCPVDIYANDDGKVTVVRETSMSACSATSASRARPAGSWSSSTTAPS